MRGHRNRKQADLREWLIDRFYGILDGVLSALVIAGLVYLFAAFSGWLPFPSPPLPYPFSAFMVGAVGALIPVVLVLYFDFQRYKKPAILRNIAMRRIRRKLDLERLGFSQYVNPDPMLVDRMHHFQQIRQRFIVEGYDGLFVMRYKGANVSNRASRFFRDSVVGDGPADVSIMNIRVMDKARRLPLAFRVIKDEPYQKLLEVYFHKPLNQGERFDIEISCCWPGTFTRRDDYVFYPLHYYEQGVEHFVGQLVLNAKPSYIEGIEFDGRKTVLAEHQPETRKEKGKYETTWRIEEPRYIYLLQYGRQDL